MVSSGPGGPSPTPSGTPPNPPSTTLGAPPGTTLGPPWDPPGPSLPTLVTTLGTLNTPWIYPWIYPITCQIELCRSGWLIASLRSSTHPVVIHGRRNP